MKRSYRLAGAVLAGLFAVTVSAVAQSWDLPSEAASRLRERTDGKLQFNAESRGRYEVRTGQSFGADPNCETGFIRTRLSMTYRPVKWLKFSGMMQDSRAPWFGVRSTASQRNETDLQESYVELFPDSKTGFGMTFGRMMKKYGDGRLLSSTDWGNVNRTFDHARLYWRFPKATLEILAMAPVKARMGEFDRPQFGERIWGTYNAFPNLFRKSVVEAYYLRREQNRPGGYTGGSRLLGTDKLGINTFGSRVAGPIGKTLKYTVEGALQTGKVGPAKLRAGALAANMTKRWTVSKMPFDLLGEYRFASGTDNPSDTTHSGTFDQLYAANHNPFGHMDLFAWKNIHVARSLATLGITKAFAVNAQFSSFWLASTRDSLYNGSGKSIARSANGASGRHVGVEPDVFITYKYQHFTVGAGYGYLFKGDFVRNATRGVNPSYAYVFHGYSF